MRKKVFFIFMAAIILCCASAHAAQEPDIKNIIFMVPDGGGYAPYDLANEIKLQGGFDRALYPYATPLTAGGLYMNDYLIASQITNSLTGITDSAAAGTALSSGYKTINGYVGIDEALAPHATLAEASQLSGKALGLVTTCPWNDATPAAFFTHTTSRENYSEISRQILNKNIRVVLGSGFGLAKYGDITQAEKRGYTIVQSREDLERVKRGDRLWGNIRDTEMPYDIENWDNLPNLAEMTRAALTALSDASEEGFFLLVEGSKIDDGGHYNGAAVMAGDYLAFDAAFAAAVEYAKNRTDTMVIAAADHDSGGMLLPDDLGAAAEKLRFNQESGSDITWETTAHTGRSCGVWLYVPAGIPIPDGASTQSGYCEETKTGYILDNTQIASYIARIAGLKLRESDSVLFQDVTHRGTYDPVTETFTFSDLPLSAKNGSSECFFMGRKIDLNGQLCLYINGRFYVPLAALRAGAFYRLALPWLSMLQRRPLLQSLEHAH